MQEDINYRNVHKWQTHQKWIECVQIVKQKDCGPTTLLNPFKVLPLASEGLQLILHQPIFANGPCKLPPEASADHLSSRLHLVLSGVGGASLPNFLSSEGILQRQESSHACSHEWWQVSHPRNHLLDTLQTSILGCGIHQVMGMTSPWNRSPSVLKRLQHFPLISQHQ